jgi:hypothetical protein
VALFSASLSLKVFVEVSEERMKRALNRRFIFLVRHGNPGDQPGRRAWGQIKAARI